jgi:hypothetical protein
VPPRPPHPQAAPPPVGSSPPPQHSPPRGTAAGGEPPKQEGPGGQTAPAKTPVERAVKKATIALLLFTALTVVSLAAWFARTDEPWGFASFIAVLAALLGAGTTAFMWRQPTRDHAISGLIVMGLSLLRVGVPTTWTLTSLALIAATALLAIPIVQAVIVLPRT